VACGDACPIKRVLMTRSRGANRADQFCSLKNSTFTIRRFFCSARAIAESVIAAGAWYRAPAAGAVSVTSTLSFFAQAAETGSNSPSVTKAR